MSTNELESVPDDVRAMLSDAVKEWLDSRPPEELRAWVADKLDAAASQIVRQMIGFEKDTWGQGWRIDHCNGRQSDASQYIRQHCRTAVDTWLANNLPLHLFTEVLTEADLANLKKQIRDEYYSTLRSKVREWASRRADEDFTKAVQGMILSPKKDA